jgi:hypothetical protein
MTTDEMYFDWPEHTATATVAADWRKTGLPTATAFGPARDIAALTDGLDAALELRSGDKLAVKPARDRFNRADLLLFDKGDVIELTARGNDAPPLLKAARKLVAGDGPNTQETRDLIKRGVDGGARKRRGVGRASSAIWELKRFVGRLRKLWRA